MPRARGRKRKVVLNKEQASGVSENDFALDESSLSAEVSEHSSDVDITSDVGQDDDEAVELHEVVTTGDLIGDGAMGLYLSKKMKEHPGLSVKQLLNKLRVARSTVRTYEIQFKEFCKYILPRVGRPYNSTDEPTVLVGKMKEYITSEVCLS